MEDKKASVRIYGQDYTISGERDEEAIVEIAAYVDEKMREIAKFFSGGPTGSLAVLAAVNITDELFEAREKIEKFEADIAKIEGETQHYEKMWEEAKKSFAQYKEEAAKTQDQRKENEDKVKELEDRCAEFENSYFDLQMENIKLKNELEKLRQ